MQNPAQYVYWWTRFWINFYFGRLFGGKYFNKSAWVSVKDGEILFVRSKKEPELFYCVGGKIESGETDKQALIRETYEEVDVTLIESTIAYLATFYGPAPDGRPMRMSVFNAHYEGTLKPSSEIAELAWFTKARNKTTYMGELVIGWMHTQGRCD